ncbi:MAG: hypothetical protein RI900_2420 [Actinomycetota bacterium]|jgi:hypothetical protein
MNTQLDEQHVADQLRSGFAGATYDRSATSFAGGSRLPYIGGTTLAAAAAVTGLLLATSGGANPALAWSPAPAAVTAADEVAVRAACTVDPAQGSEGRDALSAPVEALPAELPPLVVLDLRGTGGLATFADANWTATCLVVRTGDGFERGPVVLEPTTESAGAAPLAVSWAASTTWQDGSDISMMSGVASADAVTVEVSVPGQPVAVTNVVNGRFNLWWIGALPTEEGTIRALDAAGGELAEVALAMGGRP